MDVLLIDSAIKRYERPLKVLISSPIFLITGGMVTDVLIARNVVYEALNYKPARDQSYLYQTISENKLFQKIEQLDLQLREQTSRILAAVNMVGLRDEANMAEGSPIVIGWWWYLDQDLPTT
jgi:uncharacterized protein YigE (DUF2233 family)